MAATKRAVRKKSEKARQRITRSSGNVFTDLGFDPEEAAHLLIRSDLMIAVGREIEDRHLTQAQAASLLGVTQPRVSDLVRGRIDLFSIDSLVEFLARLGVRVELRTAKATPFTREPARSHPAVLL